MGSLPVLCIWFLLLRAPLSLPFMHNINCKVSDRLISIVVVVAFFFFLFSTTTMLPDFNSNSYAMSSSSAAAAADSSSVSSPLASSKDKFFWGCLFVAIGSIFFVSFVFAAIVSKLLPQSDNAVISAIQNDWYYCFLVPLTFPVLLVAVYFHWLSMKLFKHA